MKLSTENLEKLKEVAINICAKKGECIFVALAVNETSGFVGYDLLISADWSSEQRTENLKMIFQMLAEKFETPLFIDRAVLFSPDEDAAVQIKDQMPAGASCGEWVEMKEVTLSGRRIDRIYYLGCPNHA